ncbi:MAG: hypothetical protein JSS50_05410 [Proteobacteria bacterium]|nr:hypothetical protein [Pseudomonadota bacterium]
MSDLLHASKKRLQAAFHRLEKVVELHEDERQKMRQKVVELEAVVHHLKTEQNMLMRLQEQLTASRRDGPAAEGDASEPSVKRPAATTSKRAATKKDRPLNIEGLQENTSNDHNPLITEESAPVISGMEAAAMSIREFKAIAQRVNESS